MNKAQIHKLVVALLPTEEPGLRDDADIITFRPADADRIAYAAKDGGHHILVWCADTELVRVAHRLLKREWPYTPHDALLSEPALEEPFVSVVTHYDCPGAELGVNFGCDLGAKVEKLLLG